jgi:hypothetical protein
LELKGMELRNKEASREKQRKRNVDGKIKSNRKT